MRSNGSDAVRVRHTRPLTGQAGTVCVGGDREGGRMNGVDRAGRLPARAGRTLQRIPPRATEALPDNRQHRLPGLFGVSPPPPERDALQGRSPVRPQR